MKNLFFALLAFVSFDLFANASPNSFIKNINAKSVVVNFDKWTNKEVTVAIKNAQGTVLSSEKLTLPLSQRTYNLAKLEEGTYFISLEDGQKVSTQEIEVGSQAVEVVSVAAITYKPSFVIKENVWAVHAFSKNDAASLTLLDIDGNVIYTESFDQTLIQKRLNVQNLNPGKYDLVYSTNNEIFYTTIVKK